MPVENKMLVEVWSDVVCPFCYIGKRHYEKALAAFPQANKVQLEFKSYQLDSDYIQDPENQESLTEALARKYQKPIQEIEAMQAHIKEMAATVGLQFNMEQAIRFNTYQAHQILKKAKEKNIDHDLHEAFFAAYFTEGKNLGKKEVLKQIAIAQGLSEADVEEALANERYAYEVKQDIQEAASLGVKGVPFFVFNRKYAISGAQPTHVFLETLQKAYKEWTKSQPTAIVNVAEGSSCDVDGNCTE